jgi:hypothetical protein
LLKSIAGVIPHAPYAPPPVSTTSPCGLPPVHMLALHKAQAAAEGVCTWVRVGHAHCPFPHSPHVTPACNWGRRGCHHAVPLLGLRMAHPLCLAFVTCPRGRGATRNGGASIPSSVGAPPQCPCPHCPRTFPSPCKGGGGTQANQEWGDHTPHCCAPPLHTPPVGAPPHANGGQGRKVSPLPAHLFAHNRGAYLSHTAPRSLLEPPLFCTPCRG